MEKLRLRTKRSKSEVQVQIGNAIVVMRVSNWDKSFSELDDFALWIGLPFAMREGKDLLVEGPVSREAVRNASKLIELWSTWVPQQFAPIEITANNQSHNLKPTGSGKLMCFSGGVDSTYALAKNYRDNDEKVQLLTVHGMDYRKDDSGRFTKLLEKTAPARERFSEGSILIWSDAYTEMKKRGVNTFHSFGFHLASALFLFENRYSSGAIAADNPNYLEVICMPYGSNSISNPFFKNHRFGVETWGLEASRSQKLGYIAKDEEILSSLTFCKDYSIRPDNCGVCPECLRVKGIFVSETGKVPKIFLINDFDVSDLNALAYQDNFQIAAMDIIWSARRNGRMDIFQELEQLVKSDKKVNKFQKLKYKTKSKVSARIKARHLLRE